MANWTRKAHWAEGLFILVALTILLPISAMAASTKDAPYFPGYKGEKIPLVKSDNFVALQYTSDTNRGDLYELAKIDSRALGVEPLMTLGFAKQIVMKGDRAAVEKALGTRSDLRERIVGVEPIFFFFGKEDPKMAATMTGRVMIHFEQPLSIDAREKFFAANGLTNTKRMLDDLYSAETSVSRAEIPAFSNRLAEENKSVSWVEPGIIMPVSLHSSNALAHPNDPFIDLQWHLTNNGDNTYKHRGKIDVDLDVPRTWNTMPWSETSVAGAHTVPNYGQRNPPLIVVVFDTGTDLNHEDWKINTDDPDNLLPGTSASDPVNQSVLDTRLGYDYVDQDPDPSAEFATPSDGHGTSVAGIIAAARNNGKGVSGIAPGVRIYTARIIAGDATSSNEQVAQSIIDVTDAQMSMGNHSWGFNPGLSSPTIDVALRYSWESGRFGLGMPHFCSSGNDGMELVSYPASSDYSISVGGVGDRGNRVSYSNYGEALDFVGPTLSLTGTGIVTTDLSGPPGFAGADSLDVADPFGNYTKDSYEWFSGTSASCPAITGVAALIMGVESSITVTDLVKVMSQTADRFGDARRFVGAGLSGNNGHRGLDGYDALGQLGYGMPNPYNALLKDYANTYSPAPLRLDYWLEAPKLPNFGDTIKELDIEPTFDEEEGVQLVDGSCHPANFPNLYDRIQCRKDADPYWICYGAEYGGDPETGRVRGVDTDEGFSPIEDFEYPMYVLATPYEFTEDQITNWELQDFVQDPYIPIGNLEFSDDAWEPEPPGFGAYLMSTRPSLELANTTIRFNPRGMYLPNYQYVVQNNDDEDSGGENEIDIHYAYERCLPVLIQVMVKHELGTQNASEEVGTILSENDVIEVFGDGNLLGRITGDSRTAEKPSLIPAVEKVTSNEGGGSGNEVLVASWGDIEPYRPQLPESQYYFNTYVFQMPYEYMDDESLQLEIRMTSGSSYLPVYDGDNRADAVRRDYRGFQLADIAVYQLTPKGELIQAPNQGRVGVLGTQPIMSPGNTEEIFLADDLQTVRVAQQESFTDRALISGSTVIIDDLIREPVPIFHSDTQILNMDSDYETMRILYTSNSPTGARRLYTIHSDGYDEVEIPTTEFPTFATFSQSTDRIYYTNGSQIRAIYRDGSDDTFLFDDVGADYQIGPDEFADLSGFGQLTVDYSDGVVVFTAVETVRDGAGNILTNGDGSDRVSINLYAAPTISNPVGEMARQPVKLVEWSTWERNPKFSYKENRLAFASNANSVEDPTATGMFKIYILENIEHVISGAQDPYITSLLLPRMPLSPEEAATSLEYYLGGDVPRWSTDGDLIGFIGFRQEHVDADQVVNGIGEVAWVRINACSTGGEAVPPVPPTPTPYPTPTVSPTPPPSPTPVDDNLIFEIGHYDFDSVGDGWQFISSADFDAPLAATESMDGGSYLQLTANNDSTNTFGFYTSPSNALGLFPYEASLKAEPDFYLFRGYLRRTTADATMAPGLRLRVNSRDYQHYATMESYSVGEGFAVPSADSLTPMDLLFQPPRKMFDLPSEYQTYTLAFDLLNFMPEDDPNGGYRLERVDLYRITSTDTSINVLSSVDTKMADSNSFATAEEAETQILGMWESGALPERHGVPEMTYEIVQAGPDSYRGRFMGRVVDSERPSFGFWSTIPLALSANVPASGGPYFLRMRTSVNCYGSNASSNPEIRYRISSARFSTTVTQGIVPSGSYELTPSGGQSAQHYTFFPIPGSVSGDFPILIGWDVMNFVNWPNTNSDTMFLDSIQLDVISFANYPAVDETP
ncbi:S8 family serine peptidase [bacterium]|nr:S8 family serine peptidase [bacterium]